MSSIAERRRAPRLPCRLPVRLLRGGHVTYALAEDASRTGLRLRVPLTDLGLPDEAGLPAVVQRLEQRLGEACVGELGWQTVGSLVRKVLRVARIARCPRAPSVLDLGCELRVPLDEVECEALGLPLPPLAAPVGRRLFDCAGAADAALAAAVALDERRPRAGRRRAVLLPGREHERAPLGAEPRSLSGETALVALDDPQRLGLAGGRLDAAALLLAFEQRFGSELTLLLLEGDEPLWAGPMQVAGLEVAGLAGTALEGTGFEPRRLGPAAPPGSAPPTRPSRARPPQAEVLLSLGHARPLSADAAARLGL